MSANDLTRALATTNEALRTEIAERKRVEDELRASQQQYEALVQSIDGIVWEVDVRTFSFSFVSQQAERILGYPREQWLGEPNFWASHLHPDDRDWAIAFCMDATERRVNHQFEYRMIAADGRVVWLSDIVTVHVLEDQSVRLRGIMVDVTERKRAEDKLRKQTEILQTIFDHIPLMICFFDADGRLRLGNRAWEQIRGWSLEEVRAHKLDIVAEGYPDPQERQRVRDFITAATGEWADFKTRLRDGRVIDTSWACVRLSDGTTITIGQDITARKQAQARLAYQANLLAHVHDAILATDDQFRVTAWNRAAEELYGWKAEEVLGRKVQDVTGSEFSTQQRSEALKTLAETGHYHAEAIQYHRDGRRLSIQGDTIALRDEAGRVTGYVSANRDITEHKEAEAERARLYEQVQASRAQLQILSRQLLQAYEAERRSIARELHDEIGQQLTSISLMLSSHQQLPPDQAQARLVQAQALMRDLIDQVRTLALNLRPAMLDDLGLVPALVWLFERYTDQTRVAVRFEHRLGEEQRFAPEVETTAYRIVQEALTNVARHAGVLEVTVRLWMDADTLFVVIVDQGRGFDSRMVETGASSGLAGMAERAALLGGQLTIDSAIGAGTRLTAALPLKSGGEISEQEQDA